MSRIRSIKPTFFRSLSIADLTVTARLTFIGLWTYVDDQGRGVDDARLVKAELWPLDDKHTAVKVEADLKSLEKHDQICRYDASDGRFLHVVNWAKHQRISHPLEATRPPCPIHEAAESDPPPPGGFPNDSGAVPESHPNSSGADPEASGINPPGREIGSGSGSGSGKSLGCTGTHDDDPQTVENRDLDLDKPQAKPPIDLASGLASIGNRGRLDDPPADTRPWTDPLVARTIALCVGVRPDMIREEAEAMAMWARQLVDDRIIDEAIGYFEHAATPPTTPSAIAVVVQQKAADHGIRVPNFVPPRRRRAALRVVAS